MTAYLKAFCYVFVPFTLETIFTLFELTVCQVIHIVSLPGDNWYLAIIGSQAVYSGFLPVNGYSVLLIILKTYISRFTLYSSQSECV